MAGPTGNAAVPGSSSLPPDLLTNIHGRLTFVDRLAFAAVFGARFKPEAPWLVLPGETEDTATLFSLADRRAATVSVPDPDYVVVGSSDGWLVTAKEQGPMHLVNPVTGERHPLPAITTIPILCTLRGGSLLCLDMQAFLLMRFGGGPAYDDDQWGPVTPRTSTLTAGQMSQWFYRKVVLSASPRPGSYAAMLILEPRFGALAFATAEDTAWRLARSRDGVEDAIHHRGRLYSITYSGVVEAWEEDAGGELTSKAVTSRPLADAHGRKYLAAAPDGRLMVVLKDSMEIKEEEITYFRGPKRAWSFKVLVLVDDDEGDQAGGPQWKEAIDIGEAALFVGVNNSLCVSTTELPGMQAGCVYYTEDDLGKASLQNGSRSNYYPGDDDDGYDGKRDVGVYSLRDGTVDKIPALGQRYTWPLPAWFTPLYSTI